MEKERDGFPLNSMREISMLSQCKHDNIVKFKEVVVGNKIDDYYIVMEYFDHDLKGLMEDMKKTIFCS